MKTVVLGATLALGITLTACSSSASSTAAAPTAAPSPAVFEYHADYPAYDSLTQLEDAADAVVEVVFTGESRTYELQPIAPEDPTDPQQNPLFGAPEPEEGTDMSVPPIIVTAYTATVVGSTKGDLNVGDVIEIKQLGGATDSGSFAAPDETSLAGTDAALVFLSGTGDDPYSLVTPNEGQYPQQEDGSYEPLPSNEGDITAEEVTALVEQ